MFDRIIHRLLRVPYTLHYLDRPIQGKPRATILLIHGIGGSSAIWDEITKRLPDDVRIVSIDLLGFGKSKRPAWATYNTKAQARSVLKTLLRIGINSKVMVVGHSLGSLVAIELAKRYPLVVRSMILCSPPLYTNTPTRATTVHSAERLLRRIYRSVAERPSQFVQISQFAMRYGLATRGYDVNSDNIDTYVATLRAAIINQTAFDDALRISVPTHIMRATLDPFVIPQNINTIVAQNKQVSTSTVLAGHDIRGHYVDALVKQIISTLPPTSVK